MAQIRRYMNAWSRYHHSSGFGIHSPYAYQFVRNVWRQPLPYYAYEGIHQLCETIKSGTSRRQRQAMDLISEREARLLFRVANFFNPGVMLQVGAATGIESVAMLAVSRQSRLYLYDAQLEQKALAVRVLQSQLDRVECYDDVEVAASDFMGVGQVTMLALVNIPIDVALLGRLLDAICMRLVAGTCPWGRPIPTTKSLSSIPIPNSSARTSSCGYRSHVVQCPVTKGDVA